MDKEDVHIYNGILLSHKKEWNWVICRDVDGPRDCHTEWSKSEREKQISYIKAYMWNLEKWYRWTCLQGRNRDTDAENKHMDTKGRVNGMNWETGIDIYTNMYKIDKNRELMKTCCIAQGTLLNALWWPKCEGNPKKRGYMYTYSWFTSLYSRN